MVFELVSCQRTPGTWNNLDPETSSLFSPSSAFTWWIVDETWQPTNAACGSPQTRDNGGVFVAPHRIHQAPSPMAATAAFMVRTTSASSRSSSSSNG